MKGSVDRSQKRMGCIGLRQELSYPTILGPLHSGFRASAACDYDLHLGIDPHQKATISRNCGRSNCANLMEPIGIEPMTSCLQSRRSPN